MFISSKKVKELEERQDLYIDNITKVFDAFADYLEVDWDYEKVVKEGWGGKDDEIVKEYFVKALPKKKK